MGINKFSPALEKDPAYATYKDHPPARIKQVKTEKGKIYLLLSWSNYHLSDRWVPDSICTEYIPKSSPKHPGTSSLNWYQKLIINLQNIYYAYRDKWKNRKW